jgi:DNA-binding NtrC family response regulator
MKAGAEDYLPKPFDNDELRIKVRNIMEKQLLRRAYDRLVEQMNLDSGRFAEMIGQSPAMRRVFETIDKVAPTDVTVLLRGESGTGKELVARAMHSRSPRANRSFVAVNCAAFSAELVQSELFGHEKGAFTGALARREGKFELADGGTLFLDEIGDMSLETQGKLLRVLQEKRFERVGGNQSLAADVRIIAATNQDLETMVADGRFREDLYYRIKVVEMRLPPLRERPADIPPLVIHFLKEACERFGISLKTVTPEGLRACVANPWRGNVRALKAAIEQAVILSLGNEITPAELFGDTPCEPSPRVADEVEIRSTEVQTPVISPPVIAEDLSFREAKERFLTNWERDFFVNALKATGGNISRAAERVGMYRQSFQQKLRELGINVQELGLKPEGD